MAHFFFTAVLCSLLHSIAFLSLTVGAAGDCSLFPNQTLVIGLTLVSQNQVFEMGFFSPGKSLNRFLGIWYKSTPDVVVWVANRNDPVTASQAPAFMISRNGSLVISSGKSIIWSASSSGMATNPVLQLLDSGNLIVVDNTMEGYLWQSFDYPTDTCLQGMKLVDDADSGVERYLTSWRNADDPSPGDFIFRIENQGLPDLVTLRGTTKRYRMGKWNGKYFGGGQCFPNDIFKILLVFRQERMISVEEPHDSSSVTRVTLPQDTCDEYGICGPNGICRSRSDSTVRCQCIKGFAPKFQNYWDLQDWSGGCTRTKPLNCEPLQNFYFKKTVNLYKVCKAVYNLCGIWWISLSL